MIVPRKEQFSGCLIGQCLGDALGFPVEGYPPVTCQRYIQEMLKTGRAGNAVAVRFHSANTQTTLNWLVSFHKAMSLAGSLILVIMRVTSLPFS
jgi:ADP-ribosylglycohydrolase